jgi:hypothetical protein
MAKIIDADVVLAYVLLHQRGVTMAELRKLRKALLPEFYLEIDSASIGSAVFLCHLFCWHPGGSLGVVVRTQRLTPKYVNYLYGNRCPKECRRQICESLQ